MSETYAFLSLWKGPIQAVSSPGCIRLSRAVLDSEIDFVCYKHKVLRRELMSHERRRPVAHARFELCWRLRQHKWPLGGYKYSFPEIGRALDRDHTTIIHAVQRWDAMICRGEVPIP